MEDSSTLQEVGMIVVMKTFSLPNDSFTLLNAELNSKQQTAHRTHVIKRGLTLPS
jgi:hypothetical protein